MNTRVVFRYLPQREKSENKMRIYLIRRNQNFNLGQNFVSTLPSMFDVFQSTAVRFFFVLQTCSGCAMSTINRLNTHVVLACLNFANFNEENCIDHCDLFVQYLKLK